MTIGIDIRMIGNQHGGIGRYILQLVTRLTALGVGHKFILFYHPGSIQQADWELLRVKPAVHMVAAPYRHYSVAEQVRLPKLLGKYSLDIMFFPNFNVPVMYKGPFVVTIHDVIHHKIGGVKKSHWLHFQAYKKVIQHAASSSQGIITVSEHSKKEIAETLHVSPQKISVTYEGSFLRGDIPEQMLQQVKQSFRLAKPYFMFVGVLQRNKNIIQLARGFDAFLKKYRLEMDLVIVGKADPHYPDIKHHALDIQHSDHVVFTGYVDDHALSALYKGAHAFVTASKYEGFGLPGVEAMHFGLPLAVSNIPVFNEIYDNAAVYFDPDNTDDIAEKLALVASDPQFYAQQQQKSLQRSLVYDWERTAQETLALLTQKGA